MTIAEVAALLRVDAETVQGFIEGGRLPAVKVGEDWRISRASVMAFVNAGDDAVGKERNAYPTLPATSSGDIH
jgi:excisionase family DNA binding protein